MSAAVTQAPLPIYEEATSYWENLIQQCERQVKAINAVVSSNQTRTRYIQWSAERDSISMVRQDFPSTEITLYLAFEHWGPKICGSIRGYQEDDIRFYPEEFEFALGSDPDDGLVAITSEGRSLSPAEFASYVTQNFRRSFPGLSLP